MKIVIDCNIIVSAAITDGTCRKAILQALINHQIFISEEILLEIKQVIERPKFQKYYTILLELTELISNCAELVKIDKIKNFGLIDADDEIYLKAATVAKCDYLITGSIKDFGQQKFGKTKIVTAQEFLTKNLH